MRFICLIISFILIVIGQSVLYNYQMRNVDNVSPQQMYEITLVKNEVAR